MGAKSHVLSMMPLALALQRNGHNVTFLQYYKDSTEKVSSESLHFIYVKEIGISADTVIQQLQSWKQKGAAMLPMVRIIFSAGWSCRQTLNNPEYASLYSNITSGYWDLLFVDNVFQPCGIFLTTTTANLSWIDYSTTLLLRRTRKSRAISMPTSTEPNLNAINYEPKSFVFRLTNTIGDMLEVATGILVANLLPYWIEGKLKASMNVHDFHKRAIYSFGSMSPMVDFALPQAANTFAIDYSCPKPVALSKDILEFVEDPSSKGTIVLSFGHYVKWKFAAIEIVQAVSNVLNNMTNYRAIWQYDGDRNLVATKSHVKMASWLPLPALLRHPKTVLFVNHVGIKSFLEAVCFAVPVVAIPIFGDQYRNAVLIRQRRLGIFLEKTTMDESSFRTAIDTILAQPTYKKNMEAVSAMSKEKIIDDLARGIFWIDFHFRHQKAAAHMKLKGVELCSFIFYNIDLFMLLLALTYLLCNVVAKY
uniref:glucuronosyltransferase n=1 Tax=Trichuris muris TaxID=70415 RepID=A0A5S6Q0I8_TRIMR